MTELSTEAILELASAIRAVVRPRLGARAGREHSNTAGRGGDVTFAIDEAAESLLERHLADRHPDVAFFSEDRGLVMPAGHEPREVLVVDPIDGTRPALAGLESCCVSIAVAPYSPEVTMGEVRIGCVVEIPSGVVFLAERGRGLVEAPRVSLSENARIDRMFWTYGFRGRPARELVEVLASLVDGSSVGGGTFDLGSATFDMTRIATGQLDAYVDPGPLMIERVDGLRERFEQVGDGAVLNNSPYDLAAAALILEEAGAIVTDAAGEPLAPKPLLGSGADFQMSCVAAANEALHSAIVDEIAAGIDRLASGGAGSADRGATPRGA